MYNKLFNSDWNLGSRTSFTARYCAEVIVQTETPVFAIPTILIPFVHCVKYGVQEYVQFTFHDPEAVESALIMNASIVLAAALFTLSRIIDSNLSVAYVNSRSETSTVVMNCPWLIVILSVAGQLFAGVKVQAPVVHSEFPWNKEASQTIGTISETAMLFPWFHGSNGSNLE